MVSGDPRCCVALMKDHDRLIIIHRQPKMTTPPKVNSRVARKKMERSSYFMMNVTNDYV